MREIIKFFKCINENEEFKNEIERKEKLFDLNREQTKENYKIFLENEIIPIAKKHGFSFTADDYIKFINDNSTKILNEDELEEVAGGKGKVVLPIAMAATSFFQGPLSHSVTTYAMQPITMNSEISDSSELSEEKRRLISKDLEINYEEVNEDINYKYKDGKTLLDLAAEKHAWNVAKLLITKGADINNEKMDDLLRLAVKNNGLEEIEKLLLKGATPNCEYKRGVPLLQEALKRGQGIPELLISKGGANVNVKFADGSTPLHYAAGRDFKKLAELLISQGADINAKDNMQETPLHIAARNKADKVAELLILKRADINAKNWNGDTALRLAVNNESNEVIRMLASKGAEVDFDCSRLKKDTVRIMWNSAVNNNKWNVAEQLILNGASDNEVKSKLLFYAVKNNKLELTKKLVLEGSIDINAKDKDGWTPLHVAAAGRFRAIANWLILNKADINAKNNSGMTALHLAAANDADEIVDLLAFYNAKIDMQDKFGQLPIHIAVQSNAFNAIKSLLKQDKTIVDAKNGDGLTPLHCAVKNKNKSAVTFLISNGANVNCTDIRGLTPLHYAAKNNDKGIAALLISKGANPKATDINHQSVWEVADSKHAYDVMDELRSRGITN